MGAEAWDQDSHNLVLATDSLDSSKQNGLQALSELLRQELHITAARVQYVKPFMYDQCMHTSYPQHQLFTLKVTPLVPVFKLVSATARSP